MGVDMMGLRTQFCGVIIGELLATATFQRFAELVVAMTGIVVAAQYYGEEGISVINLTLPVLALGLLLSVLNATGAGYRYSYELGRCDETEAYRQYGQAVIFSVVSGLALALVCYLGRDAYYAFMGASDRLYPLFYEYWPYLLLLLVVDPPLTLLQTAVYNDGDSRICSVAIVVQLAGNLILPYWFCSMMGIAGIGLGVACSSVLALLVCLLHFLRPGNSIHFRWYFKWRDFIYNSRYSLDDTLPLLYSGLFSLILTKFIIAMYGEAYLPVLTVVIFLVEMCILTDAIGQAAQPIVGVYRGENNNAGIRKVMRLSTKLAVAEGIIGSVLLFACAGFLPAAFNIDEPDIANAVVTAARILTPIPLVYSVLFLYCSYYLMVERVRLSVGIILMRDLVFSLALPVGLGAAFGLEGMWVGVMLAPVAALALAAIVVWKRYGRKVFPLLLENEGLTLLSRDMILNVDNIFTLQRHVEEFLKVHHVGTETMFKVMMLVEELYMLTMEKNAGRRIIAECTIFTGKEITFVSRDTGIIFDITDSDSPVSSFRSFVVSSMMEQHTLRHYQLTTSFNRQVFRFPVS